MCFTVGKRSKKGKRTNEDDRRLLLRNERNDNGKLKQANELPFFPITSFP